MGGKQGGGGGCHGDSHGFERAEADLGLVLEVREAHELDAVENLGRVDDQRVRALARAPRRGEEAPVVPERVAGREGGGEGQVQLGGAGRRLVAGAGGRWDGSADGGGEAAAREAGGERVALGPGIGTQDEQLVFVALGLRWRCVAIGTMDGLKFCNYWRRA